MIRAALVPILSCVLAAAPLVAQVRAPRDTVVVRGTGAPADTLRLDADAAQDTILDQSSRSRSASRWATPFAVESSGRAVARRSRGDVAWAHREGPPLEAPVEPSRIEPSDQEIVRSEEDPSSARRGARDTAETNRAPRSAAPDTGARPRPSAAPARTPGRPRTHTVAEGETLFGIARRYNVTAAQLRVLNPSVEPDDLEVGTVLRLPATARAPGGAGPAGGAPRPAARPAARRTHTVQQGETLYGVARRYRVAVDALRRANRLEGDQLRPGQTLVIP